MMTNLPVELELIGITSFDKRIAAWMRPNKFDTFAENYHDSEMMKIRCNNTLHSKTNKTIGMRLLSDSFYLQFKSLSKWDISSCNWCLILSCAKRHNLHMLKISRCTQIFANTLRSADISYRFNRQKIIKHNLTNGFS